MIERALKVLRTIEGGFVNDPRDNGGATNHGVSIRAVRKLDALGKLSGFLREQLDVNDDGVIDERDVPGWTWPMACEFYRRFYWAPLRLDEMPFPVALVIFDSAVNEGPETAVKHFQASQSIAADGVVGVATLAAAKRAAGSGESLEAFLVEFAGRRLDRYRVLDDAPTYFRGWANRTVLVTLDAMREAA